MENKMEDLTVNQKEAEFASQQFAQSQSNIMSGLRGAAGGSGIAALAQSLAQQGQLAAQKSAAGIGQQEASNQAKVAAEASKMQTQERQGAADVATRIASGAQQAQALDLRKTQQLFENAANEHNTAQAKADAANMQKNQAIGDAISGGIGIIGQLAGSDRKLKKNIKLIGKSPSGLNIYAFEYINKLFGTGIYQGVMSDEIPINAVINNGKFDMVDYSKLDVEFKQI
jgi:dihydroxyacetone kinase